MKATFTYNKEHMAKVSGRSLPISSKFAVEICSFIRKMSLSRAKKILGEVIELKRAIPFKRFKGNIPHRRGIGPGKYPIKASKEILGLLESAEANAQFKGLNTAELVISKIVANRAAIQMHYGRKRSRKMKRTNVEIIVEEAKKEKPKAGEKEAKAAKATEGEKR